MDTGNRNLLVEIAVMYYLEDKTQTEISKELFMSRPKVSRLLKKARELDIVDIKINYESDDFTRVIKQVQHRFGIEDVVVVKTLKGEEDNLKEVGRAAANELKFHLHDNIKIGMSWGRTIKSMVKAFKEKKLKNVRVVELFGAVEYGEDSEEFLSIGYEFSRKINGTFYSLPAPLYISDEKTREILLKTPIIDSTIKMIDECDLIITSLGVADSKSPQRIWDAHIDIETRTELLDKGAKGYLCAHFYDQDGRFIEHNINKQIIGISTESIENSKIMLVAGGLNKCEAIYSILKSGNINTLVSDDLTLKKILEVDKKLRGEYI